MITFLSGVVFFMSIFCQSLLTTFKKNTENNWSKKKEKNLIQKYPFVELHILHLFLCPQSLLDNFFNMHPNT